MENLLDTFEINDEVYGHYISFRNDATAILQIQSQRGAEDRLIFCVDSSGIATDSSGAYIGAFRLNYEKSKKDCWVFHRAGLRGPSIETQHTDLLKAERDVFKTLLESRYAHTK